MNKPQISAAAFIAFAGIASAQDLNDLALTQLFPGGSFPGITIGGQDNMDGEVIGGGGNWSGGDDVYWFNWFGGDFEVSVLFEHAAGDLDIWLFDDPAGGDGFGANVVASSLTVNDGETISVDGLAAGRYWLSIDGWLGATNDYLIVGLILPAPSTAGLFGLGVLLAARRRR